MLIKPNAGQPAKIKVVGVGGGGGNALSTMIAQEDIVGVEFIAMNTDAQALLNHKADIKIQIGDNFTKGLGSGGDPEVGRQAAEESREKIREELDGADMVFIAAGEGGGTGTGASPIVAEISRELGALTVAVVTRPFIFEGAKRKNVASEGIESLREKVDTLIVVPNQKVLEIVDTKASVLEAFKKVDSILHQGVKGIAELITIPGLINVDFADVRSIMKDAGTALMGIGIASGEGRASSAVKQAISSPLLEASIQGAKGVLFNIVGGTDLTMPEVDEAASLISKAVDPEADIIFGAVIDERIVDQIRITVIATRIDNIDRRLGFAPYVGRMRRQDGDDDDDGGGALRSVSRMQKDDANDNDKVSHESKDTDTDSDALGEVSTSFTSPASQDDAAGEFDSPAFLRRRSRD